MHGTVYANNAVNEADVLLAFGVRFDDRVTGKVEKFAEHGTIVHIDIDASEINKNKAVRLPINADVKVALRRLNALVAQADWGPENRYADWHASIQAWKAEHPLRFKDIDDAIQPQYAISLLHELTRAAEAIVTTGVGQHQMWAGQFYDFIRPRTFHDFGGPRRDGLRFSGGAWRQGGLSGTAGRRYRRGRLVPDERCRSWRRPRWSRSRPRR